MQLADEHPMHGRLRPYLIGSGYGRAGCGCCRRVHRQSHRQQELKHDPHGRQFIADSFSAQSASRHSLGTKRERLISQLELIQSSEQHYRRQSVDEGRKQRVAPDPRFASAYKLQADGHVNKAVNEDKGKRHQEA